MPDLWIEVDLDVVKHNYKQIISRLASGAGLIAVVKADAYGLGAVEVAKALLEEGCTFFAVTTITEGLTLRQQGITANILVLGPSQVNDWKTAVEADLQLTVSQVESLRELDKISEDIGKKAHIQLKIETGMGRTGFKEESLDLLISSIYEASNLEIIGAYTHFARGAQKDIAYTRNQHHRFWRCVEKLEEAGIDIPVKHLCNSATYLDFPEYHYDFVRVGTLIGGHFPSPAFEGKLNLKDPWVVTTRIAHLQKVPKGTYVGYQSLYKSKTETTLAVIPAGYADGFGIEPKMTPQGIFDLAKIIIKNTAALFGIQIGREKILLMGKPVRIAGKVGMQLTVLDIGHTPCAIGDKIRIPIRRTLASPRIPRLYKKDGEIYSQRTLKEGFLLLNTEYSNVSI